MMRIRVVIVAALMAAALCACGTEPADSALAAPVVKNGVMRPGEDCVEVYFEWEPVDGADGYEVKTQNKYYEEETYREPAEVLETVENSYVAGAQDYFDFKIKVRAIKEDGGSRVYSEWSNEAVGSAYEAADVAK